MADEGPATFGRKGKEKIGTILTLTSNLFDEGGRVFAIDVGWDEEELQAGLRQGEVCSVGLLRRRGGGLSRNGFESRQNLLQTLETGEAIEAIEHEACFLRFESMLHKPTPGSFAMRRRMRKIMEGGMSDGLDFPVAQSLERIGDELAMCIEKL